MVLILGKSQGFTQDSIQVESLVSFETKGQHNIAALNNNFDCINCITGRIEDNPIHHLGIYTGLVHELVLNDKYSIETGLYMEERSHSGGNNTISNIAVFPKILIKVEDSIIRNGSIKYSIKGGDFWNEDVGDILRIYNVDYQGLMSEVVSGNVSLGFMTIGDLSRNIGLDLHQLYKFWIGYKGAIIYNQTSASINELHSQKYGNHPTNSDFNLSNYSKFKVSSHSALELQFETRINRKQNVAGAGGVRFKFEHDRLRLTSSLRYYSTNFNLGYNGYKPRYSGINGSYKGPQLYPLKNFYRDLSQWALYTHSYKGDLITFELTGEWQKPLFRNVSGFCAIDFNYIYNASERVGKAFPIYNVGLQVEFLSNFIGKVSATNKHMELRHFYQTASISKRPFLSLGVAFRLDKMHLGTKKIWYVKKV